jgi:hypothetical protein
LTRSHVAREIVRLPDNACDTVLRDTPAYLATSAMVAMVFPVRVRRFPVRRVKPV